MFQHPCIKIADKLPGFYGTDARLPGRVRHQLQVDERRVDQGVTKPARHEVDRSAVGQADDWRSCA